MRDFHRITKGLEIDRAARVLQGSGAPGTTTDTNTAQIGSLYLNTLGDLSVKQLAGSGTNKWQTLATESFVLSALSWREPVEVADTTSAVLPSGTPGNPIIVDGESITDGQRVLFAIISGGNGPNIYIYDQPSGLFTEDTNPETQGDSVVVKRGTYANRRFVFDSVSWLTYDALFQNTVVVQKDPGIHQFDSIKDAIDFVAAQVPSASNPWAVFVYPGIYTEDTITVPQWTALMSVAVGAATIIPSDPDNDIIVIGGSFAAINGFIITGATGVGAAGVRVNSSPLPSVLILNEIGDCYENLVLETTGANAIPLAGLQNRLVAGTGTIRLVRLEANGSVPVTFRGFSSFYIDGLSTGLQDAILITGTGAEMILGGTLVSSTTGEGYGIRVADGGVCASHSGFTVDGFDTGIYGEAGGAAIRFEIDVGIVNSGTLDLNIDHPSATGFISGAFDPSLVVIDNNSTVSLLFNHTNFTKGISIVGDLFLGTQNDTKTNVTDLIQESTPIGALSDFEFLSPGVNPLDIDVAAGHGYCENTVITKSRRVEWSAATLTLADDANNFIYVTAAGVVSSATSEPNPIETVRLGRVRTQDGAIAFIAETARYAEHLSSLLDDFLRDAVGPLFTDGCITTENAVTDRALDVTNGTYRFGPLVFTPTGGTEISFIPHYHTGGVWGGNPAETIVDNTQYDDGTDLTALTAGFYTKHALYVGGQGAEETYKLVYGSAEYATQNGAETAPLPAPPPYFNDIVVPIAALVVQEGNTNIVTIFDIRPRIGFASSVAGVTDHGDLTGLLDNDHPQYLLRNGTNDMLGNLDMGGNNIVDVNLVDGIDVTAHASRHLPSGADAITTASAVGLTPSSTNTTGTANSLARSDHTHQVTGFSTATFLQRFTFQADQFDNPVTANWAINALAPASADTANSALTVRRFDDTTEEGVGGQVTVPSGAVNVTFYFKSRAQTAPGATAGVQPTFYHRLIPDNAAVGAWSAALNLTAISIPTNTNFQYDSQTISLATLGWSAGEHRQFELTRRGTQGGDTLTGDWDLLEMIMEFTT